VLEGRADVDGLDEDVYALLGLNVREDRELEGLAREDALDEGGDTHPPGVLGIA